MSRGKFSVGLFISFVAISSAGCELVGRDLLEVTAIHFSKDASGEPVLGSRVAYDYSDPWESHSLYAVVEIKAEARTSLGVEWLVGGIAASRRTLTVGPLDERFIERFFDDNRGSGEIVDSGEYTIVIRNRDYRNKEERRASISVDVLSDRNLSASRGKKDKVAREIIP
ncbi:MAG: hypothetical protein ACUVXI_08080 [bacterium]